MRLAKKCLSTAVIPSEFAHINQFMYSRTRQLHREKSREKKKELLERFLDRRRPDSPHTLDAPQQPIDTVALNPAPEARLPETYGQACIHIYRDEDTEPSIPAPALVQLVNHYLDVATNRSRKLVMIWPASPKTLAVVHVLATLERWARGDKLGIRGLIFPAKTNAFYPLNHLHLDRANVITHAERLLEPRSGANAVVARGLPAKDAFLYSMAKLKSDGNELFNPTMSELIPHFFGGVGFQKWESCAHHLLEHISAKLFRRAHKKALRSNCDEIGAPKTAPDAFFALDGRMSKEALRKALVALKREGSPEVILVNATRPVRHETRGWASRLTWFCLQVEEVFGKDRPGVLVVTDEPHAAFALKKELNDQNSKRQKDSQWKGQKEYWITAICNGIMGEGLLPLGVTKVELPAPREFDIGLVDTEAARVISRLYRIARQIPGGRDAAQPVLEAAGYLSRLAALPCGVSTVVEWLSETGVSDHSRRVYSWSTYYAALSTFERGDDAGTDRKGIQECLKLGTQLYDNYQAATPFAIRLADLVGQTAQHQRRHTIVVFTSAIYRRLAERFLTQYKDYPGGIAYNKFADRVTLIPSSQLDEYLNNINGGQLILAGLSEESLRLLMTDNRVPKHTTVLLTQRSGQYLRSVLLPLTEKFDEFKQLKPRMESILRQLNSLPADQTILSLGDFVLPTFRPELLPANGESNNSADPEAWNIILQDQPILLRRPGHRVYVYDPASSDATDRGFRECEVQSLQPGDKLFVMSSDLRELVEGVLRDAGVPIERDKTFEGVLRDYHQSVINRLNELFPGTSLTERVRQLRATILINNDDLVEELPAEQSVRHWVNLGDSPGTPFDQLRPQAPKKEAHFVAFAETLGFSKLEAAYYWQRVIMPVRNARILDGRHVSDLYAYMLLQPESAMVHSNIKRQTLKMLFQKARENIAIVEQVIPPVNGNPND